MNYFLYWSVEVMIIIKIIHILPVAVFPAGKVC
jgi:hypothetical protein